MTIANSVSRNNYIGNGSVSTYSYSFKIFNREDILVTVANLSGVETTLALTTDYTVTGVGDTGGGSITLVNNSQSWLTGGFLTTGFTMSIRRSVDLLQDTDIRNQGAFFPETHEDAFDYLTMIDQQQQDELNRSIKAPETDAVALDTLPTAAERANTFLAFNASGQPIAATGVSSVPVSTFMTTVLDDTTAAGARATLGVSGINIKIYGVTGNGTTDDSTNIQTAVTAALASGAILFWPEGNYLTTASISNLHSVRHRGPGIILRGSDTFAVEPKGGQTNIIYVATSGNDTNDGLSTSQPRLTPQSAGNIVYGYPYSDAQWDIKFAAGTYTTTNAAFSKPFPSSRPVRFFGAAVADGVSPTTIFDDASAAGERYGFYFQNHVRAYVEDIFFKNYVSAADLSSGIVADSYCVLETRNVWTFNCAIGINATACTRLRQQAGIIDGNNLASSMGVRVFSGSTCSIGQSGTAASVLGDTGPAILNCNAYGVLVSENGNGHVDYTWINACVVGIELIDGARIHLLASRIGNATQAVRCRGRSSLFAPASNANVFTSNTNNLQYGVLSTRIDLDENGMTPVLITNDTGVFSTQSTSPVTIFTKTFEAGEIQIRGRGFDYSLWGEMVGTANTKTIVVTLGATTLLTATIAATTLDYKINVSFRERTNSSIQKVITEVFQNGVVPAIAMSASIAEDLSVSKTLTVTHQVTNAADRSDVGYQELIVIK